MLYGIFRFNKPIQSKIGNLNNLDFEGGEKLEESYRLIGEKLEIYFQSKPYLQSGFNLSNIARETQIPYNQITLFFQVYLKVNFSDWKNSSRINHAKDLISNGQAKNVTLEAIALSCGYLSRSNFINAFKKLKVRSKFNRYGLLAGAGGFLDSESFVVPIWVILGAAAAIAKSSKVMLRPP